MSKKYFFQFFKSEHNILLCSTVILGVLIGLSSILLSLFLELMEYLFLNFKENIFNPTAYETYPIQRFFAIFIGGSLAGLIWYFLRNSKNQRPVTINKALTGTSMPIFGTIVHVLTQLIFVGSGGSIGRELAPRESAAMIASKWNGFLQKIHVNALSVEDKQLLIASAAGAGFAGIYIAPVTGMLFSVELLLKKTSSKTVTISFMMSIIATLIGSLNKGFGSYYFVTDTNFDISVLPFILLIAPLCGIFGELFKKACQWAQTNQTTNKKILWQLPLIAFITGIIAIYFPEIMGNGRALAQLSISNTKTGTNIVTLFFVLAFFKSFVTIFSIKSGASGGTLTPSIALGGSIGAIVGSFLVISPQQGALIGACSLLATSQKAPLMALFMIFEVSHLNYSALLPLAFGECIAIMFGNLISKLLFSLFKK